MVEPRTCRKPTCTRVAQPARHGYCEIHARAHQVENPNIDATQATRKVEHLLANGWTTNLIATQAGVSKWSVQELAKHRSKQVRKRTHDRLQAVPDTPPTLPPAWRTQRRLRSLQAAGWTQQELGRRLSLSQTTLSAITIGKHPYVTRKVARLVDEFYRAHFNTPVQEPSLSARRAGWVPPMWWDDIDDPDEQPGVSHCTVCHRPLATARSPLCKPCRKAKYRAENPELIKAQSAEYYRRRKAERNAA